MRIREMMYAAYLLLSVGAVYAHGHFELQLAVHWLGHSSSGRFSASGQHSLCALPPQPPVHSNQPV